MTATATVTRAPARWPATTGLTPVKVRTYTRCSRCGIDLEPSVGKPRTCWDCRSVESYVEEHGSNTGLSQHYRAGETPCDECRTWRAADRAAKRSAA